MTDDRTQALAAWLRAQLDTAEQEADFIHADSCPSVVVDRDDGTSQRMAGPCDCGVPQFLRADVNAKRRLLTIHARNAHGRYVDCAVCHDLYTEEAHSYPCETLRLLALPLAGNLGYQEEWRP